MYSAKCGNMINSYLGSWAVEGVNVMKLVAFVAFSDLVVRAKAFVLLVLGLAVWMLDMVSAIRAVGRLCCLRFGVEGGQGMEK